MGGADDARKEVREASGAADATSGKKAAVIMEDNVNNLLVIFNDVDLLNV